MKPVAFLGDSLEQVRGFPESARREAGHQLDRVQRGLLPQDYKPLAVVGRGAYEIRVQDRSGAYRVIYITKFEDAIYVLHAFQKKAQQTPKAEIELARQRLNELTRR